MIEKLATQVKINVEDGTLEEELNECLRDTLRFGGYTNGIAVDLSNSTSRSRILLGEFLNVVYCGCDDYNTPRRVKVCHKLSTEDIDSSLTNQQSLVVLNFMRRDLDSMMIQNFTSEDRFVFGITLCLVEWLPRILMSLSSVESSMVWSKQFEEDARGSDITCLLGSKSRMSVVARERASVCERDGKNMMVNVAALLYLVSIKLNWLGSIMNNERKAVDVDLERLKARDRVREKFEFHPWKGEDGETYRNPNLSEIALRCSELDKNVLHEVEGALEDIVVELKCWLDAVEDLPNDMNDRMKTKYESTKMRSVHVFVDAAARMEVGAIEMMKLSRGVHYDSLNMVVNTGDESELLSPMDGRCYMCGN